MSVLQCHLDGQVPERQALLELDAPAGLSPPLAPLTVQYGQSAIDAVKQLPNFSRALCIVVPSDCPPLDRECWSSPPHRRRRELAVVE